jgi:hypothetical protein
LPIVKTTFAVRRRAVIATAGTFEIRQAVTNGVLRQRMIASVIDWKDAALFI